MRDLLKRICGSLYGLSNRSKIVLFAFITVLTVGTIGLLDVTYNDLYKASILFCCMVSIYHTSINMYDMYKLKKEHKNNDRLREVCDHRINIDTFIIIFLFYILNEVF